jgi:hypothetical protein
VFFLLATVLLSRFNDYKQPEDLKSSAKYFHFLRNNFHPLEAFHIPHGQFTSMLVDVLCGSLRLGSGDALQDIEEVAALCHTLLSSGPEANLEKTGPGPHYVSTSGSNYARAITSLSWAVINVFLLGDAKLPPVSEKVIQVLREAGMTLPDSHVSYALAHCLAARFLTTHVTSDYEEAIAIADKIIATHSPGDKLTNPQINATSLIHNLVLFRLNSSLNPEYVEDAIHRFRTLLSLPPLPDQVCPNLANILDTFERQRFGYFGASRASGNSDTLVFNYHFLQRKRPGILPHDRGVGTEDGSESEMVEKESRLNKILTTVQNGEISDVQAAVELSRSFFPLQHPGHAWSDLPTTLFAEILRSAHTRTDRLDYLNEAINTYRDIYKMSAPKRSHFQAGSGLLSSVVSRYNLLHLKHDFDESMQLFPELVNNRSAEVFVRFRISNGWAHFARDNAHPSTSTAYEMAMSLMEETLVFSPTLQVQHFRLACALRGYEGLPSDYASHQIEMGQIKQAIESLERGRALIWSEMRGLRTSTDQLRAANPALADKLVDINWRLESVMMSVAQSDSEQQSDSETVPWRRKEMDLIGHLVFMQRRLLEERNTLISHIQSLPAFENFLKPPSFDVLNSAAEHGPVIIINQSQFSSYIIILLKDSPPSVISTPSDFYNRVNLLKVDLLQVRKDKGLDSKDYELALASVLADLYELVGKPVIERLHQLEVPEKSQVWWCPTDAFCSLPLHAMGPIPSDNGEVLYFLDLYVTSYTPTLSALMESCKPGPQPEMLNKPSLLLVAQPETLPGASDEIDVLEAVGSLVTALISEEATPTTVVASLRNHRFVHFVCHGLLETGKPFDASFELHRDNLTLLEIARSHLPAAEFAFLSACHTAELTENSVANEGLHLAAAMQFCGFRSVIGTMWAMADMDGAVLSKHFYKYIFMESVGHRGVPYHKRSARALQFAVKKLQKKRGITLERWVNFVHYGA